MFISYLLFNFIKYIIIHEKIEIPQIFRNLRNSVVKVNLQQPISQNIDDGTLNNSTSRDIKYRYTI